MLFLLSVLVQLLLHLFICKFKGSGLSVQISDWVVCHTFHLLQLLYFGFTDVGANLQLREFLLRPECFLLFAFDEILVIDFILNDVALKTDFDDFFIKFIDFLLVLSSFLLPLLRTLLHWVEHIVLGNNPSVSTYLPLKEIRLRVDQVIGQLQLFKGVTSVEYFILSLTLALLIVLLKIF